MCIRCFDEYMKKPLGVQFICPICAIKYDYSKGNELRSVEGTLMINAHLVTKLNT